MTYLILANHFWRQLAGDFYDFLLFRYMLVYWRLSLKSLWLPRDFQINSVSRRSGDDSGEVGPMISPEYPDILLAQNITFPENVWFT